LIIFYLNKHIKYLDTKHSILWFWDEKKLFWVERNIETLVNVIMIMIRLVIAQKIQVIEKEEIENLFKRISKLFNQLDKVSFCSNIVILVKNRLYN
jgi:hypothetical protein